MTPKRSRTEGPLGLCQFEVLWSDLLSNVQKAYRPLARLVHRDLLYVTTTILKVKTLSRRSKDGQRLRDRETMTDVSFVVGIQCLTDGAACKDTCLIN